MGLMKLLRKNVGMLVIFLMLLATSSCLAINNEEAYHLVSQNKGQYDNVTWSPDGDKILVELEDQFATLSLNGIDERILPISLDDISGPSTLHWLSETQIAFSLSFREESGDRISNLMVYDLNQNKEQMLLSTDRIYEACWSQTEQVFVLVMRKPVDSDFHAYGNVLSVYNPQSNELSLLLQARHGRNIIDIDCGPSNSMIAFVELEGDLGDDTHRLIIVDIPTKKQQIPFERSDIQFDSPTWSPDGKWIAVRSLQGQADSPIPGIMLIATDGSETRTVMEPNFSISPIEIAWSPVENLLLVRSKDGFRKYSLYSLDLTPWLEGKSVND